MNRFLRACAVLILLSPVSAWAQLAPGVALELDFLNPGARNLALAGVAAGLADDATAVLTNPAGLSILARPEISAEFRAKRVGLDFLSGGTITSPTFSTFKHTNAGLNFLSVVVPAGRVVFGAYRHELSRLDVDVTRGDVRSGGLILLGVSFSRNLDFTTYGGSVGIKLSNTVSIGAGINGTQFKSETPFPTLRSAEGSGIGGNVGVHITPNPKFRVGVSYRRGAEIDIENAAFDQANPGPVKVPDVISGGFTVRPNDALLIAFDVSRVSYGDLVTIYYLDDAISRLEVPDATEFHAGVEYVFTGSSLLPALRFGTWYDPAHLPELTGTPGIPVPVDSPSNIARRQLAEAVYGPGDDAVHVTGGIGLVPRTGFEVNVGVDISSKTKLFSTSLIVRF